MTLAATGAVTLGRESGDVSSSDDGNSGARGTEEEERGRDTRVSVVNRSQIAMFTVAQR